MKISILTFSIFFLFTACGDPVDKPEDCSSIEYFEDAINLCQTCPPILAPKCAKGCGFEIITEDSKSSGKERCPTAQCTSIDSCDLCEKSEFFSNQTLSCETCVGVSECKDKQVLERTITDGRCYTQCK